MDSFPQSFRAGAVSASNQCCATIYRLATITGVNPSNYQKLKEMNLLKESLKMIKYLAVTAAKSTRQHIRYNTMMPTLPLNDRYY